MENQKTFEKQLTLFTMPENSSPEDKISLYIDNPTEWPQPTEDTQLYCAGTWWL